MLNKNREYYILSGEIKDQAQLFLAEFQRRHLEWRSKIEEVLPTTLQDVFCTKYIWKAEVVAFDLSEDQAKKFGKAIRRSAEGSPGEGEYEFNPESPKGAKLKEKLVFYYPNWKEYVRSAALKERSEVEVGEETLFVSFATVADFVVASHGNDGSGNYGPIEQMGFNHVKDLDYLANLAEEYEVDLDVTVLRLEKP